MGLLNHLFGDKKGIAHELEVYGEKRISLWEQHLSNYPKREQSVIVFSSHEKIIIAIKNTPELEKLLDELEELISEDVISIESEERTEKKILEDLDILTSAESRKDSNVLIHKLALEHHNQNVFLTIFRKIHAVLALELHVIKSTRKKLRQKDLSNIPKLLYGLWTLVSHQESILYRAFNPRNFMDEIARDKIQNVARTIILEEEFKEEEQSDEHKFVSYLLDIFGGDDSEHYYGELGMHIFSKLAEMTGSMEDYDDHYDWINRFEEFYYSDEILSSVIREFHRKSDEREIKLIMTAFRSGVTC